MILPGRGRLVHEQRQHVEQASEIGGRPMGEDEGDDGDLLRRHVGSALRSQRRRHRLRERQQGLHICLSEVSRLSYLTD